jgi:hypothetical protein
MMMIGGAFSLGWLTALFLPCFDVEPQTILGRVLICAAVVTGTVVGLIEHRFRHNP